jgi:hypothetical protein
MDDHFFQPNPKSDVADDQPTSPVLISVSKVDLPAVSAAHDVDPRFVFSGVKTGKNMKLRKSRFRFVHLLIKNV